MFLVTSTPSDDKPYNKTLAWDYLATESKPITPIYLDINDYISVDFILNVLDVLYIKNACKTTKCQRWFYLGCLDSFYSGIFLYISLDFCRFFRLWRDPM